MTSPTALDKGAPQDALLTPAGQSSQPVAGAGQLANKEVFLQLLVAQIRNQNPLNPSDGTEFVAQLAQFSQLEATIEIQKGVEQIRNAVAGSDREQKAAPGAPGN